jgi:hypothetical protein
MLLLAQILGILASAAAVLGLLVTGWQIRHELKEKQLQQWEEVVVYSICVEGGIKGVTLKEIQGDYDTAAKNLPVALPREAQQTDTVKRTLISLEEKNAIVYLPNGTYAPLITQPTPSYSPKMSLYEKVDARVVRLVRQEPHKYTEDQLRSLVGQEFPEMTGDDMESAFGGLVLGTDSVIAFDSAGKAILKSAPRSVK